FNSAPASTTRPSPNRATTRSPSQSGGRGVIVMALDEGEALAAVAVPADDAVLAVEGIGRGGKAVTIELKPSQREPLRHRRARKGVPLTPKVKPERMR
ncbi:hypothetical protein, partial [Elstera cyanobacteriorum]|uniref:hypothetical protein n=1 Tax=Elstera cyanobacteriorum TaxID=2022747 RepID=UPI0023F416D7